MRSPRICALLFFMLLPSAARAQEQLAQRCQTSAAPDEMKRYCNLVAEAVDIAHPRVGLAMSGGNPVPGTASTFGMRLGLVPRLSIGGRITAVMLELPPLESSTSSDEIKAALPAISVDAALGVFSGLSLFPTIGGFGSVDLVASAGMLPLPKGEGFAAESPKSYAIGARVGILRESFVAPGIAVTAMYRKLDDVSYGDEQLQDEKAYFTASDVSTLSVRGTVGKRLLFLGALAGVGWDRYTSDVAFGVANPTSTGPARIEFVEKDFQNDRVTAFANVSWTLLVLSLVGELGWQAGGDKFPAQLPTGKSSTSEKSTWYGSLAIRLSI